MPHPCPLCLAPRASYFGQSLQRPFHRCGRCELTFLEPALRPSPQEERAEYELHHNDPHDPGYRRYLQRLTAPLTEGLPPGSHGLDFGCGPTPAVELLLAEEGMVVESYDPIFAPRINLLERTYDFVVCSEVVEHMHDPRAGFLQLAALISPGGRLGVMTQMLVDSVDFVGWHYARERSHVCFYRPHTMAWIAEHHGWEVRLLGVSVALFIC